MRREIIQSKTEPNKNNLWLSEEGLKKYGKNGWEPLGSCIYPNTPIVESISGDELIPIKQDGENKAVRADELVKGGKEVFILTPDMFEQAATTAEIQATLTFTDDGWADFVGAFEANKIIALDFEVGGLLLYTATPMGIFSPTGFIVLNSLISVDVSVFRGYISFPSQRFWSPAIYEIIFSDKNVYSSVLNTPSEVYYLSTSTYSTAEDFNSLEDAVINGKIIIVDGFLGYIINVNDTSIYIDHSHIIRDHQSEDLSPFIKGIISEFKSDGTIVDSYQEMQLLLSGDGSKFLANDGSYKEVSGGDNTFVATLSSKYADIKSAIDAKKQILFDDENGGIFTCNYSILNTNIYLYYRGDYNGEGYPVTTFIEYKSNGTVVGPNIANKHTINRTVRGNAYLIPDIYYIDTITATSSYNIVASTIIGEYAREAACFEGQIIFGDTVYNVSFSVTDSMNGSSSGIKWSTDSVLEYKANHTYQFRIVNNLGVMKEFANA